MYTSCHPLPDAPAVNVAPVESPDDTTEIFRQPDDEVERKMRRRATIGISLITLP